MNSIRTKKIKAKIIRKIKWIISTERLRVTES